MSMLSAIDGIGPGKLGGLPRRTSVLYTSRRNKSPDDSATRQAVLFEDRLLNLAKKWNGNREVDYKYTFYETSSNGKKGHEGNVTYHDRRILHEDLFTALGPEDDRQHTVVYVCGLPGMTDEFVEVLRKAKGMDERRVLVEKWW